MDERDPVSEGEGHPGVPTVGDEDVGLREDGVVGGERDDDRVVGDGAAARAGEGLDGGRSAGREHRDIEIGETHEGGGEEFGDVVADRSLADEDHRALGAIPPRRRR